MQIHGRLLSYACQLGNLQTVAQLLAHFTLPKPGVPNSHTIGGAMVLDTQLCQTVFLLISDMSNPEPPLFSLKPPPIEGDTKQSLQPSAKVASNDALPNRRASSRDAIPSPEIMNNFYVPGPRPGATTL
jgi:hypothetical protein